MNMLSTILYSDVATLAIMAGTEYCISNRPIGRVPSVMGVLSVSAINRMLFYNAKLTIVVTIIGTVCINFVKIL